MPKKVRELKQMLQKAGFTLLTKRGKGSHSYWIHPVLSNPIVLSGKDSKDAKPYQEKDVIAALEEVKRLEQEGSL
ncbi:ycfA-like family protein [Lyngbya aestuarii BL J]|uniref:YcfA-like family protein n=1 Tax=Lyngbya aestuarii BL J TaxID=1348334 RepID=U7QB72_9CYAN|nr:type II toxin-antitoxin system HicA family toxin [Lyngbya aestuarii]ERT04427.1 ycfA-like family protein [Lyngbya aestuarii BL J]